MHHESIGTYKVHSTRNTEGEAHRHSYRSGIGDRSVTVTLNLPWTYVCMTLCCRWLSGAAGQ